MALAERPFGSNTPASNGLDGGVLAPNAFIDPKWYLDHYPDVADAGANPFLHYIEFGWKENRSSGPNFNASVYLSIRPEASEGGKNEPIPYYIANDLGDAELHVKLGHEYKRQGMISQAAFAYRRALELEPTLGAISGLRELGLRAEAEVEFEQGGERSLWIDVSDLIESLSRGRKLPDALRSQLEIVSAALRYTSPTPIEMIVWQKGAVWRLSRKLLMHLVAAYFKNGDGAKLLQTLAITAIDDAVPAKMGRGDALLKPIGGSDASDEIANRALMRRAGIRIGFLVYDYAPLTNPELCAPDLVSSFSNSISEALIQAQFVVTASEAVANETKRLMAESGYPAIPVNVIGFGQRQPELDPSAAVDAVASLVDGEYVLCVVQSSMHNNEQLLVNLWRILLRSKTTVPKLVIVQLDGALGHDTMTGLRSSDYLSGHVVVIEATGSKQVAQLLSQALFVVHAPFVDGLALIVGESLAHGKVCVASRDARVAGIDESLVLYFDPYNLRDVERIVSTLIDSRDELRDREAAIRDRFVARTWEAYVSDLVGVVDKLALEAGAAEPSQQASPRLSFGQLLGIRSSERTWRHEGRLAPIDRINDIVLPRKVLGRGWGSMDDRGAALIQDSARLSIPTDEAAGQPVRVVLRFDVIQPWHGLTVEATVEEGRPSRWTTSRGSKEFIAQADGIVAAGGKVAVSVSCSTPGAVKLIAVLCLPVLDGADTIEPGTLIRPASLCGPNGRPVAACSTEAIKRAAKRRAILRDGWMEPEDWGAWIASSSALVSFRVPSSAASSLWHVVLRLRVAPNVAEHRITLSSGQETVSASTRHYEGSCLILALPCSLDADRRIELNLSVELKHASSETHAGIPGSTIVGIEGLTYVSAEEDKGPRLSDVLIEGGIRDEAVDDETVLRNQLRYEVVGHVNGNYSLAGVNRQMVLALEDEAPGSIRLSQVEGRPTRDVSGVPVRQIRSIRDLLERKADPGGMQVSITQHWPILEPEAGAAMSLAYTFWEESGAPPAIVDALNSFAAVLAPSRFVAKTLRDCGLSVPIRHVGFAPDLKAFLAIGERRARRPSRTGDRPLTFLHVSSCFPRKGADLLVRAMFESFTSRDNVRLIIKTFPNPHNSIENQIDGLRQSHKYPVHVETIMEEYSENQLLMLYESADVMVLPTRGEGFNIPAAEALAAGLSVIVTGFGAHLDFVGPGYVRLIDYTFSTSQSHLRTAGSVWAEPDFSDLKAALKDMEALHSRGGPDLDRRLALGRAAAIKVSDSKAWAERIQNTIYHLLDRPPLRAPRIAWVSTWDVKCGIAEYSRHLLEHFPGADQDVVVLCDDRTETRNRSQTGIPVQTGWRVLDSSTIDEVAAKIELMGSDVVVVQHHPGLIGWQDLAALISHPKVVGRDVYVQLHNVQQILPRSDASHGRLIRALAGATRVLVHTVNDINILRSHSDFGNITLLPHGAPEAVLRPRRPQAFNADSAPLIGAYGYMLPHKGFRTLVEAMPTIVGAWPRARLRMVTAEYPSTSSRAALDECHTLARTLGIDHAIEWHTEYLPTIESIVLLNECDLVVLPYQDTQESSSAAVRTALTAMAPVAVTPLKIFDDVESAVVRLSGSEAHVVAGGIQWLLNHRDARDEAQRLAGDWLRQNEWRVISRRLHGLMLGLYRDRGASAQ